MINKMISLRLCILPPPKDPSSFCASCSLVSLISPTKSFAWLTSKAWLLYTSLHFLLLLLLLLLTSSLSLSFHLVEWRAAMSDHIDVMEFLLQTVRSLFSSDHGNGGFQGADIDARDVCKRTALLLAALKSSVQAVCYLLSQNASLLYRDESDRNLLHFIIMQNLPIETIGNALFCRENFRLLFDHRDVDGCSPIHYASREGQVNMLTTLIRQGAEINKKTNQRQSSLHFAAQ